VLSRRRATTSGILKLQKHELAFGGAIEFMGEGIGKKFRCLFDELAIEVLAASHALRNSSDALLRVLRKPSRRE